MFSNLCCRFAKCFWRIKRSTAPSTVQTDLFAWAHRDTHAHSYRRWGTHVHGAVVARVRGCVLPRDELGRCAEAATCQPRIVHVGEGAEGEGERERQRELGRKTVKERGGLG